MDNTVSNIYISRIYCENKKVVVSIINIEAKYCLGKKNSKRKDTKPKSDIVSNYYMPRALLGYLQKIIIIYMMMVMIYAMAKGENPQKHPTSSAVDSSRGLGRAFLLTVEPPYLGFEGAILSAKVV